MHDLPKIDYKQAKGIVNCKLGEAKVEVGKGGISGKERAGMAWIGCPCRATRLL